MLEPPDRQRAGPGAEALARAGEGEAEDDRLRRDAQGSRTTPTIIPELGTGGGLQRAAELIEEDWERMVSYYGYPMAHWRHLRTTNVIESPFAALRLRTDAAKRFKKVAIRHGGDLEDAVGG